MANALRELWTETLALTVLSWQEARRLWKTLFFSLIFVLLLALIVSPNDSAILKSIQNLGGEPSRPIAEAISFYFDFYTGSIALVAVLWLCGFFLKRPDLRTLALACFLSAAIAGTTVNMFRLTLGRPRPSTGVPDGFYGLQASAGYHGFPSGHSATAFGTMAPIAFLYPPFGVPAIALAASVGWSRMQLNRHHITDVLVGAWFGCATGFILCQAVRRRKDLVSNPPQPTDGETPPQPNSSAPD
jgi:membrane-associated phospholipid phosphatase